MKKREAIMQAATVLFSTLGFDATTTLEIANVAAVTEPLLYYYWNGKDELFTHCLELAFNQYFSRLDELPKHTPTEFQKIANIIDLHFQIVDDLPEQIRLIVNSYPSKLNDPNEICLKNIKKARQLAIDYFCGSLKAGIMNGEFRKVPVSATANILVALLNGLLRQKVYKFEQTDGVKDATIDFCKGSLTAGSTIQ